MDLKKLKNSAAKEIKAAEDLKSLQELFKKYLGKQGELTQILRSLKDLPKRERIMVGKEANEVKNSLSLEFDEREAELKDREVKAAQEKEWIDVTAPGKKIPTGSLHPLTQARRKAEEIFQSMGFEVAEGPDIETEWYNFDALNIPKDHPARDVWDTFYLKNGFLLRTHTSPVQVRYMEKNNPPLRIIVPGTVYRHEATDPSHEFQLQQIEGLMVDKNISVANLKAIVGEFFKRFFEKDIDFRLRPDFFPFTEPSFDISITCLVCKGKGCPVCKESGWLEVAGAGMVHPNVFKAAGLVPGQWQGWAFGFGLERLVMLKHKINDIRLFRSGDLRFLKQF
ncbi:MAG: phenylalanine--tRNA ligase subunit alpha [Candidatus Paceibacterota bacterium]|jgi:phenylalanyl-tRNA synthetase alpha chain|nr:phenylalanine--tRNA ligase subunit alpha [Candidatus Paceibacterota bacterium]